MQPAAEPDSTRPNKRPPRRPPISVPGVTAPQEPATARADSEPKSEADQTPLRAQLPSQPLTAITACGFAGALMMTLAFCPLGLGQLAFVAVAPWAWLTLDARPIPKIGYLVLYLAGSAQWLCLSLIEIEIGQGALLGNLPTIAYLAGYVPLFVWLGRVARRLLRFPAYITLPIIWCGLEWLRCHIFGGFSLGLLAHAAADTRRILQLTDIAGSLGLGFLMIASGSSIAELVWVARRIRRLEKRIPLPNDDDQPQDSTVFTAASQFAHAAFTGSRRKKPDAQTSMAEAMRRNRDRAREVHLTSVTLSVCVMVAVLVFANSYGRSRVDENATWKLFESNQFKVAVLGGQVDAKLLAEHTQLESRALLVAAGEHPKDPTRLRRPVMTIEAADGDDPNWTVTLSRGDEVDARSLGELPRGATLWARDSIGQAFAADTRHVPLNLMTCVAARANVEHSVNSTISKLPNHGRSIDAVVVGVRPGYMDGGGWPRLMTRSVIASAVANRCPVIVVVPQQLVSVAAGDGRLWWSSAMGHDESESPVGDPLTDGKSTNKLISTQAMIDPRVSRYAAMGDSPAAICALLTLCIPITTLIGKKRHRAVGKQTSSNLATESL